MHKKLNISPVSKRFRGSYNIVVLKPTGHRGEPEVYLPRTSYYDEIEGFEQKCEDCPHEGDPPCGDFNPGPYCFPAQEVDENPSCNNCMFNKTEGCPFIDIDQGDNGRPQICDQWHEIIEIE